MAAAVKVNFGHTVPSFSTSSLVSSADACHVAVMQHHHPPTCCDGAPLPSPCNGEPLPPLCCVSFPLARDVALPPAVVMQRLSPAEKMRAS
jgi:hypothetical protein